MYINALRSASDEVPYFLHITCFCVVKIHLRTYVCIFIFASCMMILVQVSQESFTNDFMQKKVPK